MSVTVLDTIAMVIKEIDLVLAFIEANKSFTIFSTGVGLKRPEGQ